MIDQATVDKIIDSANILEVVSDFVTLAQTRCQLYRGYVRFMMKKPPLSVFLLQKEYANVSVAVKVAVQYISLWNMNNSLIMKP